MRHLIGPRQGTASGTVGWLSGRVFQLLLNGCRFLPDVSSPHLFHKQQTHLDRSKINTASRPTLQSLVVT